jgi:heptosyltransferase I
MSVPGSICILRLSALGDVTHVVPLVHRLRAAWPDVAISWIIGKPEARLLEGLPGVEFIVIDKGGGFDSYRTLARRLRGRAFDALLLCQVALRANLLSTAIRAERRIGFDVARSKDLHGLFVRERIAARSGIHVLEAILSFAEPLGAAPLPVRWNLPVPEDAIEGAERLLPGDAPTLLLSPCSSHTVRNWLPKRYAAVADHAARAHGLRIALCGGRSKLEREVADAILAAMREPALDLVGRDTLKQFLALCRKSTAILTPDSGPMHIANAMGLPVIGLHAASNPRRSGPYSSIDWCVDRYDAAARKLRGKAAAELPWGTKLEYPGVMELIETEAVMERLDAFMAARQSGRELP